VAIVGIVIKLAAAGRFDRLAVGIYLAMGWSGFMVYDTVVASLPPLTLWFTCRRWRAQFRHRLSCMAAARFQMRSGIPSYLLGAACHFTPPCSISSF
jgi:hemolysin III